MPACPQGDSGSPIDGVAKIGPSTGCEALATCPSLRHGVRALGAWRWWATSPCEESSDEHSELVSSIRILGILVPVQADTGRALLQELEAARIQEENSIGR